MENLYIWNLTVALYSTIIVSVCVYIDCICSEFYFAVCPAADRSVRGTGGPAEGRHESWEWNKDK